MHLNRPQVQQRLQPLYENAGVKPLLNALQGPVQLNNATTQNYCALAAARLASMLVNKTATPASLLCICSSEAMAMRVQWQLRQLIGGEAEQVIITTLPAFSNLVIGEHQLALPAHQQLKAINPLEHIRILQQLINRFDITHPLKKHRADVYHDIIALDKLFSFLQTNGFTGEYIVQQLASENYLPFHPVNCDSTPSSVQEEEEYPKLLIQLRAGLGEYAAYKEMICEARYYHPAAAAILATTILRDHPALLTSFQHRFRYVQVDAFNGLAQPETSLLQQLFAGTTSPNLLVAGGPSSTTAPGSSNTLFKTLSLTPLILDGASLPVNHPAPSASYFTSIPKAMEHIVQGVEHLLQQQVPAQQVTIVCNKELDPQPLQYLLEQRNIPFINRCNTNLLHHPFTRPFIQLLRYIYQEQTMPNSAAALLFELLHTPFLKIPPAAIAEVVATTNRKKHNTTPTDIRSYLQQAVNAPPQHLFDTGLHPALKTGFRYIDQIVEQSPQFSLGQLFQHITGHTLVTEYIAANKDSTWLLLLLNELGNFIQLNAGQQSLLQLSELIELLDLIEQEAIVIPMDLPYQSIKEVQLVDAAPITPADHNYLFIIGNNQSPPPATDWFSNLFNKGKLPGFLNTQSGNIQPPVNWKDTLRDNNPGPSYIYVSILNPGSEIGEQAIKEIVPVDNIIIRLPQLADPLPGLLTPQYATTAYRYLQPTIATASEVIVKQALDKFVLSASALNSYLRCPLHFYYHYILRVPNAGNEAMEFGSALHYALELLFKKLTGPPLYPHSRRAEQFIPVTTLVNDFTHYMQMHRGNFKQAAFERRLSYGVSVLTNYYHHYLQQWNKVVAIERNISGVFIQGIPIKGKLDKLEFNGKEVTIVDYKSGDYHKAISKLQPPNANEPNGGDYWRQAVFYTLLVNNYQQKDWKVVATEIDFIEPDNNRAFRKLRLPVQDPDITTVTQQIITVSENIRAGNFYTGCGEPTCHWCRFVKDNQLNIFSSPHPEQA